MYLFGSRQIFFDEPDSGGGDPGDPVAEKAPKAKPDLAAQVAALKAELADKKRALADAEKRSSQLVEVASKNEKLTALIADVLIKEHESAPEFLRGELNIDDLKADPVEGLLVLRKTKDVYERLRADLEKDKKPNPDPTKTKPGEAPDVDTSTRVGALKFLANLRKDS